MKHRLAWWWVLVFGLWIPAVAAQTAPSSSAAPGASASATAVEAPVSSGSGSSSASASDARKEQSRAHFERGVVLIEEEAWAPALAEFLQSRALNPTRGNTKNAALCLRKLHRFDEAYDMFLTLLKEFPELGAQDKKLVEDEIHHLANLVGAIEVKVSEPGATLSIDGRERGTTPMGGPIRVSAGSHLVKVFKDGFVPYESSVDVAGTRTVVVEARLQALQKAGRLRIVEQGGRAADVVVDGTVVGKTPWEGRLGPGAHVALLRGEGSLGTQPVSAPVRLDDLTLITLELVALDTELTVEPQPAGASVMIDGVNVGRGIWRGRLKNGAHQVEIVHEGFLTAKRNVTLGPNQVETVRAALERDPESPMWRSAHPDRIVFEVNGAAALSPTLGGNVASGCSGSCDKGMAVGWMAMVRGSWQRGSGLGVGLDAGLLSIKQSTTGRDTKIQPLGLVRSGTGRADDELALTGMLLGAHASLQRGETWPWMGRVGAGVLLGKLEDTRSGVFQTTGYNRSTTQYDGPVTSYSVPSISQSPSARYVYVAPEFRLGFRPTEHLVLSAGLEVLVLISFKQPTWKSSATEVPASTDGRANFPDETLTSRLIVVVSPGVGARYEF